MNMYCHRIWLCNQLLYQLSTIFHKRLDLPYWLQPFFEAVLWSHLFFKLVFLFLSHIIRLHFDVLELINGLIWNPSCIEAIESIYLTQCHLLQHKNYFLRQFFRFFICIHELEVLIEISLFSISPLKFCLKMIFYNLDYQKL